MAGTRVTTTVMKLPKTSPNGKAMRARSEASDIVANPTVGSARNGRRGGPRAAPSHRSVRASAYQPLVGPGASAPAQLAPAVAEVFLLKVVPDVESSTSRKHFPESE